jgi:hypothetical protein
VYYVKFSGNITFGAKTFTFDVMFCDITEFLGVGNMTQPS